MKKNSGPLWQDVYTAGPQTGYDCEVDKAECSISCPVSNKLKLHFVRVVMKCLRNGSHPSIG
eukprot:9070341-Lingulodinium_polyedra.AAC.1